MWKKNDAEAVRKRTYARDWYRKLRAGWTQEQRDRWNAYMRGRNKTPHGRDLARDRHRKWSTFIGWLKAAPCMDCGGTFPSCVMDFDHRDPTAKARKPGANCSLETLQAELRKCDLVCANCHRIRTHVLGRGSVRGKRRYLSAV